MPDKIIHTDYEIAEVVYLVTDRDQEARIVVGFYMGAGDKVRYKVSCGTRESEHYDFEISREINVLITSRN